LQAAWKAACNGRKPSRLAPIRQWRIGTPWAFLAGREKCGLGEPKCKMVGIDVHSVDEIKAMGIKALYT